MIQFPAEFDIIDDVYTDPDEKKEWLLNQNYATFPLGNYPGRDAQLCVDPTEESYKRIMDYFCKKGIFVKIARRTVRKAMKYDFPHSWLHYDNFDFQVVINLTKNPDVKECIAYYAPVDADAPKEDVERHLNNHDFDYFEKTTECELMYNRGIVISSRHIHAPTIGFFGNSASDCRLVEIYSIHVLPLVDESMPYTYNISNVLSQELCMSIESSAESMVGTIAPLSSVYGAYDDVSKYLVDPVMEVLKSSSLFHFVDDTMQSLNVMVSTAVVKYNGKRLPWSIPSGGNDGSNGEKHLFFDLIVPLQTYNTGVWVLDFTTQKTHYVSMKMGDMLVVPSTWLYMYKHVMFNDTQKICVLGKLDLVMKDI